MHISDLVTFLKSSVTAVDDATAVTAKELYKDWSLIEENAPIAVGDRVIYKAEGEPEFSLYKAIQAHNKQSHQPPSIHTAALWTRIDESHAGTIEDPIPVPETLSSFEYEWGKYYKEGDTLYRCNREKGKEGDKYTLNHKPSQLVGHYFEVVGNE